MKLRTLPNYHLTPLLLLTTESSPDRKIQGKQAGATGWMVKPFNPDILLERVSRLVKSSAMVWGAVPAAVAAGTTWEL